MWNFLARTRTVCNVLATNGAIVQRAVQGHNSHSIIQPVLSTGYFRLQP